MSTHYSIDGADGTDPILVVTTRECTRLERMVITKVYEGGDTPVGVDRQEGVSMYSARVSVDRPRPRTRRLYVVSKWFRYPGQETQFVNWNRTHSKPEAEAMFVDLEKLTRSEI